MSPQQFTNVGTLIDGQIAALGVRITRNGVRMMEGGDYVRQGGLVKFFDGCQPIAGDTLAALVYRAGTMVDGLGAGRSEITPFTDMPKQFSSNNGTIRGIRDGINTAFHLWFGVDYPSSVSHAVLHKNGQYLIDGTDFVRYSETRFEMLMPPQPDDVLLAKVFDYSKWSHPVKLSSANGDLLGSIDGVNDTFSWQLDDFTSTAQAAYMRMDLYRNGVLLEDGVDYGRFGAQIKFSPSQIPSGNDVITTLVFYPTFGIGQTTAHQFSSTRGGVTGVFDGTNTILKVGFDGTRIGALSVFRNGLFQLENIDYARAGNMLNFTLPLQSYEWVTVAVFDLVGGYHELGPISIGAITGKCNGTNRNFLLAKGAAVFADQLMEIRAHIFRNGILQTRGTDYTRTGNRILLAFAPGTEERITAVLFPIREKNPSSAFQKALAPIQFPVDGTMDGANKTFKVVVGPTILGVADGINTVFTTGVYLRNARVYLNGVFQRMNKDVAAGGKAIKFLSQVPQPDDLIMVEGWA